MNKDIEHLQARVAELEVALMNIRDAANTDQYHASLAIRRVYEMCLEALEKDS